jgi:hypothetical protein
MLLLPVQVQAGCPADRATGLWPVFQVYDPGPALKAALKFLEQCRQQSGNDVGLIYDVHRRAIYGETSKSNEL